jgi:uncharacterized protein YqjF (DUF2071 family)
LREAEVLDLHESLFAANGLVPPSEPPLAQHSPGTAVRLGLPRRGVFPTAARG